MLTICEALDVVLRKMRTTSMRKRTTPVIISKYSKALCALRFIIK